MTRACKRCRRLGILTTQRVYLPDASMIEEHISLCHACRDVAEIENKSARQRLAKVTDIPILEFLFTAPSAKEPSL